METGYKVGGQCIYNVTDATQITKTNKMEKVIKSIEAKIAEFDKFEKQATERGNVNMTIMYVNQKIGLLTALNIALEEQGKEISGE